MHDICVPLPRIPDATHAEVEVKVEGKRATFNYRVESFDWTPAEEGEDQQQFLQIKDNRINTLRESISNYDSNWELVQIYNPGPRDNHIQVLFREKTLVN